jgi:hypothetical protein
MKTAAYGRVGDCFILVLGKVPPADADINPYLAFVRGAIRPDMKPRVCVQSYGGGLSPKQRQALNELTAPFAKVARIAVLTDSAVARGVVTAMSWFAKEVYQAFSLSDLNAALDFLQIPGLLHAELKKMLFDLSKEVPR